MAGGVCGVGAGVLLVTVAESVAVAIDGDAPVDVGVVAAGKLGAQVAGTGAAQAALTAGQRIALTRSGRCVADSIMAEMM